MFNNRWIKPLDKSRSPFWNVKMKLQSWQRSCLTLGKLFLVVFVFLLGSRQQFGNGIFVFYPHPHPRNNSLNVRSPVHACSVSYCSKWSIINSYQFLKRTLKLFSRLKKCNLHCDGKDDWENKERSCFLSLLITLSLSPLLLSSPSSLFLYLPISAITTSLPLNLPLPLFFLLSFTPSSM